MTVSGKSAPTIEATVTRLLNVLEEEVLPKTQAAIEAGNKIFGAAVLDRRTLSTVIVGTNEETANPLFHGEIACLNRYWAIPKDERPAPGDCLFLSTHEPCSLCLSAITWSGFDNFYYLFSYEDSRDAFNIPHDLNILEEVFGVENGAYRATNAYWTSYAIGDLIAQYAKKDKATSKTWRQRVETLQRAYDVVSDDYQSKKGSAGIPLD